MQYNKIKNSILDVVYDLAGNKISFTIAEIGARPASSEPEPFVKLVEKFQGSKIIAFEPDFELCTNLNETTPEFYNYIPYALASEKGFRPLYETEHPWCTSLYKPREKFNKKFIGLQLMDIKRISEIEVKTLHEVFISLGIDDLDLCKIDVQGAELEVIYGGGPLINNCVSIVSEVCFNQLYIDAPSFGDIQNFLGQKGLIFHKFISPGRRNLQPTLENRDPNLGSWLLWSDAIFVSDILNIEKLSSEKLLKLALIAAAYESVDISVYCFAHHDQKYGTSLMHELTERLNLI